MTTHFKSNNDPRLPDNYKEHIDRILPDSSQSSRTFLTVTEALSWAFGILAGALAYLYLT